MKNKKIISLLLCVIITLGLLLTGCNNVEQKQDKISDSQLKLQDVTNMEFNISDNIPEKKIDKRLYQKEFKEFKTSDLIINKDWGKYIQVGNDYLMANQFVDISELTNYYTNIENDTRIDSCYGNLNKKSQFSSLATSNAKFADSKISIINYAIGKNAYITRVDFRATVNAAQGGLDGLVENKSNGDKFSLGNTYKEVSVIARDGVKLRVDEQGDYITTYYLYSKAHVKLELGFMKKVADTDDNAILTSISWTPTDIENAILKKINN